jgi:hypothetical protein
MSDKEKAQPPKFITNKIVLPDERLIEKGSRSISQDNLDRTKPPVTPPIAQAKPPAPEKGREEKDS